NVTRLRSLFSTYPAPSDAATLSYTTLFRSRRSRRVEPGEPGRAAGSGDSLVHWLVGGLVGPAGQLRLQQHRLDDLDDLVPALARSEEHASALPSRENLVGRLLLHKKNSSNP